MTVDFNLPAVGIYFIVWVDQVNLGPWTKCEGLGCEIVMEKHEEGGNNGFVWQLPTRITYPNIRLTRPLTPDTTRIAHWISSLSHGVRRYTGQIEAHFSNGAFCTRWSLSGVVPVRWSGPTFSSSGEALLTETLEIAYHGFLGGL